MKPEDCIDSYAQAYKNKLQSQEHALRAPQRLKVVDLLLKLGQVRLRLGESISGEERLQRGRDTCSSTLMLLTMLARNLY